MQEAAVNRWLLVSISLTACACGHAAQDGASDASAGASVASAGASSGSGSHVDCPDSHATSCSLGDAWETLTPALAGTALGPFVTRAGDLFVNAETSFGAVDTGVWRLKSGATSWELVDNLSHDTVHFTGTGLAVDTSGHLFAAGYRCTFKGNRCDYADVIRMSTDGGDSWSTAFSAAGPLVLDTPVRQPVAVGGCVLYAVVRRSLPKSSLPGSTRTRSTTTATRPSSCAGARSTAPRGPRCRSRSTWWWISALKRTGRF